MCVCVCGWICASMCMKTDKKIYTFCYTHTHTHTHTHIYIYKYTCIYRFAYNHA